MRVALETSTEVEPWGPSPWFAGASSMPRARSVISTVRNVRERKRERCDRQQSKPSPCARSLPKHVLDSEAGQFAIEWLELPEDDPAYRELRSADCYRLYAQECTAWGVEALSQRRFSVLAQRYVHAFKGRDGRRWYRFLERKECNLNGKKEVFDREESAENVRSAA